MHLKSFLSPDISLGESGDHVSLTNTKSIIFSRELSALSDVQKVKNPNQNRRDKIPKDLFRISALTEISVRSNRVRS